MYIRQTQVLNPESKMWEWAVDVVTRVVKPMKKYEHKRFIFSKDEKPRLYIEDNRLDHDLEILKTAVLKKHSINSVERQNILAIIDKHKRQF